MKTYRLLALAVMLLPATAAAQTADDLIAKNIAARGGMEKIKAITSLRVTRTVGTPFSNVRVVQYRQRPNLLRTEQTPAGRPAPTASIITRDGAWAETPQGWQARAANHAAEAREIDADIDGFMVDYKEKGHRAEYAGIAQIGGKPAHHLKFTLKTGQERNVYLDPQTFLERRQTGTFLGPQNQRIAVIFDYSDWRDVNGVKFPFAIDEDRAAAGQTFAIYVETIEVNVPIDAAKFVAPVK